MWRALRCTGAAFFLQGKFRDENREARSTKFARFGFGEIALLSRDDSRIGGDRQLDTSAALGVVCGSPVPAPGAHDRIGDRDHAIIEAIVAGFVATDQ